MSTKFTHYLQWKTGQKSLDSPCTYIGGPYPAGTVNYGANAFDQAIERELENANCVVALWSENSVSSEWVKNEAAVAVERAVLVSAMIDRVKLPLEFRRKQTADLFGWHGEASHAGFNALVDGITATIGF